MKSKKRTRRYISLTAMWGNGDASSTIRVGPRQWEKIKSGEEYSTSSWAWYEGVRSSVGWRFIDCTFTIYNDEGFEAVVEEPLEDLHIEEIKV